MNHLIKIAIFTGIVLFASSCEKEQLPLPGNASSPQQENSSSQRVSDSPDVNGDQNSNPDVIVGGGDDDRDGGGGERRTIYSSGSGNDSIQSVGTGDDETKSDDIVGGGDDDRDGDGGGKKSGKKTGG